MHIDHLFLDNTYCNPLTKFPNREDAKNQLLSILFTLLPELRLPDTSLIRGTCTAPAQRPPTRNRVILGVDSLGKEDLIQRIASELRIRILASPERLHRWVIPPPSMA